jgi:hypothetical protein
MFMLIVFRKFKVEMSGGTPFAVVGIKDAEVAKRTTAWAKLKNLLGYKVKSVLEIQITPVQNTLPTLADPNNKVSPDSFQITQLLPPNIVIPSSSVPVVAIYRCTYMRVNYYYFAVCMVYSL